MDTNLFPDPFDEPETYKQMVINDPFLTDMQKIKYLKDAKEKEIDSCLTTTAKPNKATR